MSHFSYTELKHQEYLRIPGIKTKEMPNLFKWRVRMAPKVKVLAVIRNIFCAVCGNHLDNQPTFLRNFLAGVDGWLSRG